MLLMDDILSLTFRGLQGVKSGYRSRNKEGGGAGPEEKQSLLSEKLPRGGGTLQFLQEMPN